MFLDTPYKYHPDRAITLEDIAILDSLFFFQPHSTNISNQQLMISSDHFLGISTLRLQALNFDCFYQ